MYTSDAGHSTHCATKSCHPLHSRNPWDINLRHTCRGIWSATSPGLILNQTLKAIDKTVQSARGLNEGNNKKLHTSNWSSYSSCLHLTIQPNFKKLESLARKGKMHKSHVESLNWTLPTLDFFYSLVLKCSAFGSAIHQQLRKIVSQKAGLPV